MKYATREDWLHAATKEMAPLFEDLAAPLPDKIRLSIGFTSGGRKGRSVGECWNNTSSQDEHFEIFIRPDFCDHEDLTLQVLATLAHELTHAAVGFDAGHGPEFRRVAEGLGLAGKMTATHAGDQFIENMQPVIEKIGPIPHGLINPAERSTRPPKQKNRHLKCRCPECGYTVRAVKKWIDIGLPLCPVHGAMVLDNA